jgi:hypothetical protein
MFFGQTHPRATLLSSLKLMLKDMHQHSSYCSLECGNKDQGSYLYTKFLFNNEEKSNAKAQLC